MHDVLRSKIQSPSQKFHNNFINFEKPKIFKKSQKVRSNAWKRRIRTLTKWRQTWSRPKNPWGWSLEWKREREVLGGEEAIGIKRDWEKWDPNLTDPIYKSSIILDGSRGVERCQALKGSTDATIEQVSKGVHSQKEAWLIEELSRR